VTALFLKPIYKALGQSRRVLSSTQASPPETSRSRSPHNIRNARLPQSTQVSPTREMSSSRSLLTSQAQHKSLLKTKWMTLAGSTLAVVSSSAFYANAALFFALGGYGELFFTNPYLHIWTFGISVNSVLNDLGMLLVCGVLKTVPCPKFGQPRRPTAYKNPTQPKVFGQSKPPAQVPVTTMSDKACSYKNIEK
jgi:hypothetical protein